MEFFQELVLSQIPTTPTWETLVPWVVAFIASLVSAMLYWILNKNSKQMDDIKLELRRFADSQYMVARTRLVGLSKDTEVHPILQDECKAMIKEIDGSIRVADEAGA